MNSLATKKPTEFSFANFQKMLSPSYIIWRIQRANSVDPDEVAHNEPPHQDYIVCKFSYFLPLVLKVFNI